MCRKILATLTIAALLAPSLSEPVAAQAVDCEVGSIFAEAAMRFRQNGISKPDAQLMAASATPDASTAEFMGAMLDLAYERPVAPLPGDKDAAVQSFKTTIRAICLQKNP